VSLINKDLGEIRVGRDYAPTFWNNTVYDPFGTLGVGSANNVILGTLNPAGASIAPPGTAKPEVRTSNSIGWLSSNFNGFRAQVQYAFSEVPTNCLGLDTVASGQSTSNSCAAASGDGKYLGLRLTYANGPLSVSAATGTTTYAKAVDAAAFTVASQGMGINGVNSAGNVPFLGDYKVSQVAGTYDFGVAKLWAQYGTQTQGAFSTPYGSTGGIPSTPATTAYTEAKLTHYLLGVTVPMGQWTHKFSYNDGKRSIGAGVANERSQSQLAIGTVYALSKRTSLYATYGSMTAKGAGATASMALTSSAATASADVKATGYDLGISHRF
jgi:predicted porin